MRVCFSVVVLLCVCVPRAEAQRLAWDFWSDETALTMLGEHQYLLSIDGGAFTTAIAITCDDATRTCITTTLPGAAGTTHTVDIIAYWATLGLWSPPGGLLAYTVAGAPPPPPPPSQSPYLGTPWLIPGTIEAEHYDVGGEGVAFHDSDLGNNGGVFRADDVDVQASSDGGYNVGWILAGEWLEYTVTVAQTGTYTLNARVANLGPGGVFHLEMDGTNVTGALTIPDTGDWQAWTTITKAVALASGPHILRVVFESPAGAYIGNLNYLQFATPEAPPPPCTYAITPTSQAVNAAGGSGGVTVTASESTCAWTSTSNVSWVTVTAGSSGTGSGATGYSVAANVDGQRSGTLAIAGQVFTVNQAAYVPPPPPPSGCAYDGVLYPIGYILGPISMPNSLADTWLQARIADGWTLYSRRKSRGTTTFRIKCGS